MTDKVAPCGLVKLAVKLLYALMLAMPSTLSFADELDELSFEDLGNLELSHTPSNVTATTSAKLAQTLQNSPSNIHIATAEDIRTFAYRTLGEILNAMPGLYTTTDGLNTFLGVRGFGRPGDYNTRILVLVDGVRVNDNVFDSALVGREFPVDVALIERVEYAPGPGSAVYGNNAFFGVVNVFTKRANSLDGVEVGLGGGSGNTADLRLSYGKRMNNGLEILFSGTAFQNSDVYPHLEPQFSEYDSDKEQSHTVFAKVNYKSFQGSVSYSNRENDFHVGSYTSLQNEYDQFNDEKLLINAQYDLRIHSQWGLALSGTYGRTEYTEESPYLDSDSLLRYDSVNAYSGSWVNGEAKLINTTFEQHRILVGLEAQLNRDLKNATSYKGYSPYWQNEENTQSYGIYIQDEFTLSDSLSLLAGIRYDNTELGSHSNPRLALIWQAHAQTTFKFLYGSAFRAPNFFEYDFNLYDAQYNPDADTPTIETIDTFELVVEHFFLQRTARANASLYYYSVDDIIEEEWYYDDGWYSYLANGQPLDAYGLELDFEKRFSQGARIDLNYTLQKTEDSDGERLTNSPEHFISFRNSLPLWFPQARLGTEVEYVSERNDINGAVLDDYWLINLTASFVVNEYLDLSASAKNVSDSEYYDTTRSGSYEQLGRSYYLQAKARF